MDFNIMSTAHGHLGMTKNHHDKNNNNNKED